MTAARLARLAALTHGVALTLAGCDKPAPPPPAASADDAGAPEIVPTRRLPTPNAPPRSFRRDGGAQD
jgi:hypothetical protein